MKTVLIIIILAGSIFYNCFILNANPHIDKSAPNASIFNIPDLTFEQIIEGIYPRFTQIYVEKFGENWILIVFDPLKVETGILVNSDQNDIELEFDGIDSSKARFGEIGMVTVILNEGSDSERSNGYPVAAWILSGLDGKVLLRSQSKYGNREYVVSEIMPRQRILQE
jgi:hypothetical protein